VKTVNPEKMDKAEKTHLKTLHHSRSLASTALKEL
jgi:hypothetical protein